MHIRSRLTHLAFRPHLPRRTVRLRLTALYGALFLISGAGLLTITYALVSRTTDNSFVAKGPRGANIVISGPQIQVTAPNEIAPPGLRSFIDATTQQLHTRAQQLNIQADQLQTRARQLQTAALHQHANELHHLLTQSAIALAVMTIISIGLGWLVAGRVLRPLRIITTTARSVSATNLHERLALDGPDDELKELGDTFDGLLARLEASFQAQRQFVANASHELRTPLARQKTLIQVALADPDLTVESLRAAHERVLASGEQQDRLIDALLTLSRGHAGLDTREPFDLATLTEYVVLSRQSEADYVGLKLHTTVSSAPMAGNSRLVERLVANLVDNALRYNTPNGHVHIATSTHAHRAVLSVVNTGPHVPPDDVDRLLQPFQRLGSNRTSQRGSGLGLSIVDAIADAHGATMVLHPRPEGGLEVEVVFRALEADVEEQITPNPYMTSIVEPQAVR